MIAAFVYWPMYQEISPFLAKHLREFSSEVSDGRFNGTTTIVKDITGHEPRSFEQYVEEH